MYMSYRWIVTLDVLKYGKLIVAETRGDVE